MKRIQCIIGLIKAPRNWENELADISSFRTKFNHLETMLIQITDQKAHKFLEDLEDLNLIKVLQKKEQASEKLSEKYAGKLSPRVAEELQEYISKSREEWESRNT
jgi:coenzyme F420-reducing hydrogenase beta subunit